MAFCCCSLPERAFLSIPIAERMFSMAALNASMPCAQVDGSSIGIGTLHLAPEISGDTAYSNRSLLTTLDLPTAKHIRHATNTTEINNQKLPVAPVSTP